MNTAMATVTTVAVAFGLAGIASGSAAPNRKISAPAAAIAPENHRALGYFLRPKDSAYNLSLPWTTATNVVGFVPYNRKFPYLAVPGGARVRGVSEAADFMKADLLPGKTHFARMVPQIGAWRARWSPWPVKNGDRETPVGRRWIDDARPVRRKGALLGGEQQAQRHAEEGRLPPLVEHRADRPATLPGSR